MYANSYNRKWNGWVSNVWAALADHCNLAHLQMPHLYLQRAFHAAAMAASAGSPTFGEREVCVPLREPLQVEGFAGLVHKCPQHFLAS